MTEREGEDVALLDGFVCWDGMSVDVELEDMKTAVDEVDVEAGGKSEPQV